MRIYTKTGDAGTTGLIGGQRVLKDHLRVCTYGEVDELNAAIGVAIAFLPGEFSDERKQLQYIQRVLFDLGAELATPWGAPKSSWELDVGDIKRLEDAIDVMQLVLPPLRNFILPGGHSAGAQLHFSRTVARRAERSLVRLHGEEALDPKLLQYVNRLSDFLFVLSRLVNLRLGVGDLVVSDAELWV